MKKGPMGNPVLTDEESEMLTEWVRILLPRWRSMHERNEPTDDFALLIKTVWIDGKPYSVKVTKARV
jgi:hypothetical protein